MFITEGGPAHRFLLADKPLPRNPEYSYCGNCTVSPERRQCQHPRRLEQDMRQNRQKIMDRRTNIETIECDDDLHGVRISEAKLYLAQILTPMAIEVDVSFGGYIRT